MPEVMEQIGRMSRAEQIRLAHLLLDAIENGTVVKPTKPVDGNEFPFLGYWVDDRSDDEIIRDIEESHKTKEQRKDENETQEVRRVADGRGACQIFAGFVKTCESNEVR